MIYAFDDRFFKRNNSIPLFKSKKLKTNIGYKLKLGEVHQLLEENNGTPDALNCNIYTDF